MRNILIVILSPIVLAGCFGGKPSRPDNAVIQGVHYIGLSVANIERSANFYSNATNVSKLDAGDFHDHSVINELAGRKGVKASTQLLRSVNAQIRLMQFENPSEAATAASPVKVYGPGIAHLCFQVAKATNVYERFLKAGGVHIGHRDIQVNPRTHVGYAYAHDLDQTIVEIEEVDVEKLDLPTPPKNKYRIRHISLATPDIERTASFYSSLLQVTNARRAGPVSGEGTDKVSGEKGSELKFAWFQIRNLELEVIQYTSHPTTLPESPRPVDATGYNMIVFDVTDLAAAKERLIAAGGSVVLEGKPMDDADILFGRDPDGNLLGFQKFAGNSVLSAQNFANNGLE